MLIERNQVVIGAIATVVILAATAFAIGLSGGAFVGGRVFHARFADAAGLEAGDFVFVAGVRAGRVDEVRIDGDAVAVTFRLTTDAMIPADSRAQIFLSNTLGKRAIRIIPGSSSEPLVEGAEIPLERTSTPVDFPELGDETVRLLGETDVDALQAVTTAVADITEGMRRQIVGLLDGVERLTRVIAERREALTTVIDRAETVIDAAADKDREIVRIIDAFGSTLDRLAARREELKRLLRETAAATDIAADLVEERRAQIDRILEELHQDVAIVDRHQVDLAHALAYGGVAVEGFASIGYQGGPAKIDNPAWGNVFTTSLGAVGVDALLGCGGTLDQVLTAIIGPDPGCEGTKEVPPDGGAGGSAAAVSPLRAFFGQVLALAEVSR